MDQEVLTDPLTSSCVCASSHCAASNSTRLVRASFLPLSFPDQPDPMLSLTSNSELPLF